VHEQATHRAPDGTNARHHSDPFETVRGWAVR
jgi:hypothetical protein